MTSKVPFAVLIHVSTLDKDAQECYATHAEFIEGLLSTVSPAQLPRKGSISSGSFHE